MGILSPEINVGESDRLAPWGQEPGRLWSLWDMLTLNGPNFISAVAQMSALESWLLAKADDPEFFAADQNMLSLEDKSYVLKHLLALAEHLNTLGAPVTMVTLTEMSDTIVGEDATWGKLKRYLSEIASTLRRELTAAPILVIEPQRRAFFRADRPMFGDEVEAKFKSCSFEISEAAKCYALSRPTACVFHLMRALEIGIRATARCLSIPDPVNATDRNWGAILRNINAEIDRRWPKKARISGDGPLFEEIYACLDSVKNPWRNATMHVENIYTDDEAEHIFVVVKGFMKKLASRMDEHGEPKA